MAIKVTCIRMDTTDHKDPYLGISAFRWIEDETAEKGTYTRTDMYLWLVNGGHAYVLHPSGRKTYLIALQNDRGIRYVRSTEDNIDADDLLALPLCPPDEQAIQATPFKKSKKRDETTFKKIESALLPFVMLSSFPYSF